MAQTSTSSSFEFAKVLVDDAVMSLQDRDTQGALVHLNLVQQQLGSGIMNNVTVAQKSNVTASSLNDNAAAQLPSTTTDNLLGEIKMGGHPTLVAVNPNTNWVYVIIPDSNTTSVIDGETNVIIKNITISGGLGGISVNPNINTIYVSNYESNTVSIIDGTTNTVVRNLTIGGGPTGIDVNPKTDLMYVASFDSNTISVIDSSMIGRSYYKSYSKSRDNTTNDTRHYPVCNNAILREERKEHSPFSNFVNVFLSIFQSHIA